MSGWRELGYIIGGGGKNSPDAYHSGLQSVARSEGLLADAARKQAERMMFDSQAEQRRRLLQDAALQQELGWNAGQAALFGASEMGNWSQNTAGQLNVQEQALRARAEQALLGDLGPGNAALAAISGKPLELTQVQGNMQGNLYAPNAELRPTALGDAKIEADNALTAQRNAMAGLYTDKAENPDRHRAPPRISTVDPKRPLSEQLLIAEARELAKALGQGVEGSMAVQMRKRLDEITQKLAPKAEPEGLPEPAAASQRTPNPSQIRYLKENPSLAPAFDAKFGPGSAAKVLGQ